MKMKRIMGLFLALAVSIGCMSLSPIVSYADDTNTKTFNINERSVNITQSGIYKIEGTGHATSNTISVTGNSITATIILNNVNIDVSNQNQKAAFLAKNNDQSNVHLTIILKGTNSLKSGETCAGLKWNNSNNNSKLEIKGDGSLTAEGGESGAGIGGGNRGSGENITIAGGTVTATGGAAGSVGGGAAGIGGGFSGSGKNITITGGTVTAEGGWTVAGIGGGNGGSGENIKITGGSVKANSISATPADGDGNSVYLAKLESQDGVNEVTVDSGTENKKTFTRAGSHPGGDTAFYLYLTGQDHDLVTSKGKYNAEWNSNANRFAIIEFDSANVNSMSVTAPPSKVSYTEGEKLDLSGLVVTLTDDHGKTKEVKPDKFAANGIKATPKNGTKLVLTDNGAKVKLTKDGVPSVETEKLTVNKLNPTSMSVTSQPKKLKYTEGENLDLTGLEVTLEDANHVKKVVTPAQFEANGIKAAPKNGKKLELTDGGKPVTLTKDGLQAVKTSNLAVEELKPTSMSVTSQPNKLSYTEGETLDLTGLEVTLEDANHVKKVVTPAEFEANGIKATPENGTKLELTDGGNPVKLKSGNLTAETGALKVEELKPTSMEVTHQPNKLSYTEGENLALDGLVVTLKDDKGVTKDVPFADFDKYKITAAPANGTPLTVDENNGNPVKLTKPGLPDAVTGKLIVYHQSSAGVGHGSGTGSTGGVGAGSGTGSGSLPSPSLLPGGVGTLLTPGSFPGGTGVGAGSSTGHGTGVNDDAPTTLDRGELNIQIDGAEGDSKPGSAGDGSSAGNGNTVENAPEVKRADAAVKQALDRLADALAWAKRVSADANATRVQVDAAVRRLVEARKALAAAKANAVKVRAAVRNRVIKGMRSRVDASNAGVGNNALSNTVENAPGVKQLQRKPRFKTPAAKPQSRSQSVKRVGVVPKKGESALYAGLLAVLGFSVAGLAVFCRKRMMEGNK